MTDLPASIATPTDLSVLISELRAYATWFTHNAIKSKVGAKKASLPPVLSDAASDVIRAATSRKLLDERVLQKLINDLEDTRKTAPVVHITLAAPAPAQVRTALTASCRKIIARDALVTFAFNATILGGMVIAYGSHVHDWSFRRQILDNRAKFTEVLRSV